MNDISKMVCDIKVSSDSLFGDYVGIKKFAWSPCFVQSQECLLGSLSSLGLLEIYQICDSNLVKLFTINNLWYSHCLKKYLHAKSLANKQASLVKAIYLNCCSLLWIESCAWIPNASLRENRSLLVCYHKIGIVTVWQIEERRVVGLSDETGCVKEETPLKCTKKKQEHSNFKYRIKLVKVITKLCHQPFTADNFFQTEFLEVKGGRVINIEYVRLHEARHSISVCRSNGTVQLLEFDLPDLDSNRDVRSKNKSEETVTENLPNLNGNNSIADTPLENLPVVNQTNSSVENNVSENSEAVVNNINKTTYGNMSEHGSAEEELIDKVNKKRKGKRGRQNEDECESVSKKRKSNGKKGNDLAAIKTFVSEVETKLGETENGDQEKSQSAHETESINQKVDTFDEVTIKQEPTDDIENGDMQTTQIANNDVSFTNPDITMTEDVSFTNGEVSTNIDFMPTVHNIYTKPDSMVATNLIITYVDHTIQLVFSKVFLLCCIVLNSRGEVVDQFHRRLGTRLITSIAKFTKDKYLVSTYENKLLILSVRPRKASGLENADNNDETMDVGGIEGRNGDNSVSYKVIAESATSDRVSERKAIEESHIRGNSSETQTSGQSKSDNSIESPPQSNPNKTQSSAQSDLDGIPSQSKSQTSCKSGEIVIRRSIHLKNPTHTINGIANSTNHYLTILSFKIKVKFENASLHSRNPCFLSLTSLFKSKDLTRLPALYSGMSPYRVIDLVKFLSLNNPSMSKINLLCLSLQGQDTRLKYFLLKLFQMQGEKNEDAKCEAALSEALKQLENATFLQHVKRCVRHGLFEEDPTVLIRFREWTTHAYPGENFTKLLSRLPTEEHTELCALCDAVVPRVESLRYALCSNGHRIPRCSLSLEQCLRGFVRCRYCLAYASSKFAGDERFTCVFCDARLPL
ncbi:hypothetical protein M8J75_010048 [Diaphorina citri]|nr:hypothetical protein M8J75_011625 [Diaphorina citri]KAI5697421.1 hypothetical protein M8J75_010048 [Diaphorina citri]